MKIKWKKYNEKNETKKKYSEIKKIKWKKNNIQQKILIIKNKKLFKKYIITKNSRQKEN